MRLIPRLPRAPWRDALLAACLALALWGALAAALPGLWRTLEELSGDWVWRSTASVERERRILLIDIDEASLRQLGPWPWPRARVAELSGRLAEEGAAVQVFDIVFATPEVGDAGLAERLARNNAVIAQVFALEDARGTASGQPTGALPWAACPPRLPVAQGYIAPAPAFAALPAGHITPRIESDGGIRRQPAIICHDSKAYPALFLATLARMLPGDDIALHAGEGLLGPHWRLSGPLVKRGALPLDAEGNIRIPWTIRPEALISLSAADVLAGRVPQGLLKNAWVVIGSTALGLNDRVATPFGGNSAGLMVHAQILRGILDETLPAEPRLAPAGMALAALLCAAALLLLGDIRQRSLAVHVGLSLVLLGLLWGIKALLLAKAGLWLPWVGAAVWLAVFSLLLGGIAYARSRFERDRLYQHLSSYLPAPVAAALAGRDPTDAIEAARVTITALNVDIRNFAAYGESRPPEETAAVLHAFYAMTTRCVERHGGLIESFQGDAVLAIWNESSVPGELPPPEKALAATLDILTEGRAILPAPQPDEPAPLALGIGVETGLATVGSFGLARRRTHLALGRTVTAAIRLQEMTAELAHPILIGEGMAAAIGTHRLESQGIFLLEGLKTPCHIYAYPLRDCPS